MARFGSLLFDDAIIGCMTDGRNPTVYELFAVGARIWVDAAPDRSLSDWDKLPIAEQITVLQTAQFALCWNLPDQVEGRCLKDGPSERTGNDCTTGSGKQRTAATPPKRCEILIDNRIG
jgi:hypothetical protein